MKKMIIAIAAAVILSACATSETKQPAAEAPASGEKKMSYGTLKIQRIIPYRKGGNISTNIKNECSINKQLSEFIGSYGKENGINVLRKAKVNRKDRGKVLLVEITEAQSSGSAFIGHRKTTAIAGKLYNKSKLIASFTARRNSGGGFFGGFKGSCAVLGRTVKALGSDVVRWLRHPVDGAHLGD